MDYKTFIKAQAASVAATGVDFIVTILCVEAAGIPVVPSGAIGNVSGAVVNFIIGRKWVFDPAVNGSVAMQALKYGIVWFGYLILNAAAMLAMETFTPLHYIVSKMIVGLTLAVTYNYFLQKKFVFN